MTREEQIHMMATTKERHAAHSARWMKDDQILALVRSGPEDFETHWHHMHARSARRDLRRKIGWALAILANLALGYVIAALMAGAA